MIFPLASPHRELADLKETGEFVLSKAENLCSRYEAVCKLTASFMNEADISRVFLG